MRDTWLYIGVGVGTIYSLITIWLANTQWTGSFLWSGSSPSIMAVLFFVILAMLMGVTIGVVGYYGSSGSAISGVFLTAIVMIGSAMTYGDLPIKPPWFSDMIAVVLEATIFSADPVAMVIGTPIVILYMIFGLGLTKIRKTII